MKTTITTAPGHAMQPGDTVIITGMWRPWWLRLWHWIIRKKPKQYRVVSVTETTLNIGD